MSSHGHYFRCGYPFRKKHSPGIARLWWCQRPTSLTHSLTHSLTQHGPTRLIQQAAAQLSKILSPLNSVIVWEDPSVPPSRAPGCVVVDSTRFDPSQAVFHAGFVLQVDASSPPVVTAAVNAFLHHKQTNKEIKTRPLFSLHFFHISPSLPSPP